MKNDIQHIAQEFLKYIEQERHYSKHTLTAYSHDLNSFIRFLKKYDPSLLTDLIKIDRWTIRHYMNSERERTYERNKRTKSINPRTVARALACIKSFFKYLIREGYIKDNQASYIGSPKFDKHIPFFVPIQKIEELMGKPDTKTIKGSRDRAILELFYATGIRLSELVGLNIGSVNHEINLLKVIGKRKKERIVPFGDIAKKHVESYLKKRGHSWESEPQIPLFTSNKDKRISISTVQKRLIIYLNKVLGTKKGSSPHTLRHTFGTHLLDNDADIRSIQEFLGHSSISSTQIYSQVNPKKIKKIYNDYHPHAK